MLFIIITVGDSALVGKHHMLDILRPNFAAGDVPPVLPRLRELVVIVLGVGRAENLVHFIIDHTQDGNESIKKKAYDTI